VAVVLVVLVVEAAVVPVDIDLLSQKVLVVHHHHLKVRLP
jgi:hypothetical protein